MHIARTCLHNFVNIISFFVRLSFGTRVNAFPNDEWTTTDYYLFDYFPELGAPKDIFTLGNICCRRLMPLALLLLALLLLLLLLLLPTAPPTPLLITPLPPLAGLFAI